MVGPINNLSGILAKYLEQIDVIDINRNKITEIIKEVTGVIVNKKEIEIADHLLLIRSHPAKRQIIMFNKNDLLFEIQKNPDLSKILDIK